jgi:hypothetical protein
MSKKMRTAAYETVSVRVCMGLVEYASEGSTHGINV